LVADRSQEARAYAAQELQVAPDQLVMSVGLHILYPYSHQYLYLAKALTKVFDPDRGPLDVALDWRGSPIDRRSVQAEEKAARDLACPKLDDGLCAALRSSNQASYEVIVLPAANTGVQSLERLVRQLDDEAILDRGAVYARLTPGQLLALGSEPEVGTIRLDHDPGRVRGQERLSALDSNLRLDLSERNGMLTLRIWTVKVYGCCNYALLATIRETQPQQVRIEIHGVHKPAMCLETLGPAQASIALGEREGRWRINLAYDALNLSDEYILDVSPARIRLKPRQATFTWARYDAWQRLPKGSIWFVTQDAPSASSAFYADIEALGLKRLDPIEGPYANVGFVPPWPTWWGIRNGTVTIPINEHSWHQLRHPDIRYYQQADVPLEAISDVVARHRARGLTIRVYDGSGEVEANP